MLNEKPIANIDELLAKAKKPSADAMLLHPFYRGKIETTLKCTVRSFEDFAIWYTPGVAACRAIVETRRRCTNTPTSGTRRRVSDGSAPWLGTSARRPACR
jgi:malate dehydrogenase (oxaloacetate-decarboxylating)